VEVEAAMERIVITFEILAIADDPHKSDRAHS
jgi:hypothetical protein